MKHLLWLLLFLLYVPAISAQTTTPPNPCGSIEARQFDFWVGNWDLTWNDSVHGSNKVDKEMSNCVIHENFEDPGSGATGQSLSMYEPATGLWKQTWVDNGGSYMAFEGKFENGKMTLSRTTTTNGKTVLQRMIFCNIKQETFDWYWQSSSDSGATWKTNWLIHYRRKH